MRVVSVGAMLVPFLVMSSVRLKADDASGIRPYEGNGFFWQYNGEPLLLLGGSDDDNLFQWEESELRAQLDRLRAAGGNTVRNTMSSRDEGNLQPFVQEADGRYDLERSNPEYWERFERFLRMTAERNIIVQIEFWDPWDTYAAAWDSNPWNPANNVLYTPAITTLDTSYPGPRYSGGTSHGEPHDLFLTPPELQDDRLVLEYQHRFVEQILARSLPYSHVLYCITNEIHPQYPPEWGWHWARFIRERAEEADREIFITEMYWTFDFQHEQHQASLDRPDLYDFFEASQNSATRDPEAHWSNLQYARERLAPEPRPINHTKTYGADTGPVWAGTDRDATERFWRNLIGGAASSRFHRPPAGMGLGEEAQKHLRGARMLADVFDFFRAEPDAGHELLAERGTNEAYVTSVPGAQYAVYFPDGGSVSLDLSGAPGAFTLEWLGIEEGAWSPPEDIAGGERLDLQAPGNGHWVALLRASDLARAITFFASFDSGFEADLAKGDPVLYMAPSLSRAASELEPFRGQNPAVQLARDQGRYEHALRIDLPYHPILFYRAQENVEYVPQDWSGTLSFWMKLRLEDLAPGYSDPIQITSRGWNDGALFVDFTDKEPRAFRFAIFADRAVWDPEGLDWDDVTEEARPMIGIAEHPFVHDEWVHVAFSFDNFNTGRDDGIVKAYINGEKAGSLSGREQTFTWEPSRVALWLGYNFNGLLDEICLFNRALTGDEIRRVYKLEKGINDLLSPGVR